MPAKKSPADELAEKMTAVLEGQRGLGADAYPLTLRRLAELTDPAAPADLILKAAVTKKQPFAGRVVVSLPKNLDAPAALAEDLAALADSPLLLRTLLAALCTSASPTCDPSKLKTKVTAKLKPAFAAALDRRVREAALPDGVALVAVRKKQHLHLTRFPLPRPPEVVLAENLLRVLEGQRALGEAHYPPTFGQLLQLTEPNLSATLLTKVLALPAVKTRLLVTLKDAKHRALAPVGLAEDAAQLAASPRLLQVVLELCRTPSQQLFTLAEVKKPVAPALAAAFAENIHRRLASRTLPAGIGSLLLKAKPMLFLLSDVHSTSAPKREVPAEPIQRQGEVPAESVPSPTAVASSSPPFDFAVRFDAAFRELERQARLPNFVSLVELRPALACDRATFDAELRKLRLAGRYTLSAAEGRHGIRPEEQDAGIVEDGALLLFVSRKVP